METTHSNAAPLGKMSICILLKENMELLNMFGNISFKVIILFMMILKENKSWVF